MTEKFEASFLGPQFESPVTPESTMRAENRAAKNNCDSACVDHGGHRGECAVVVVSEPEHVWGVFSFCEKAVARAKKNGMTVVYTGKRRRRRKSKPEAAPEVPPDVPVEPRPKKEKLDLSWYDEGLF